ncbi:MAG: hypothetical protein EKK64_06860 [Neisseriaceae bacterium]|nr:MAG: hypothetical protein EKK64_06860 [Neisseriaceae bacterium]
MYNSTFTISMLNRRDNYASEEKRVALIGREALHNAYAQKASKVHFFNFGKSFKEYLVIAHNGTPFANIENQMQCMRPSITGDGFQGHGMKASMFLPVEKSEEAELLLHTHSQNGDFTTSLKCVNFNDAEITDVSEEWNDEIKNVMGEYYDEFNVFYIYRYVNANTKENKENKRVEGLLKSSYVRLMAEMCPDLFEKMSVHARCNYIYGKSFKYKSIEQTKEFIEKDDVNNGRFPQYPSLSRIDKEFCTDSETFNANFSVNDGDEVQQFEGKVEIFVYPNLTNNYGRCIVMNGEKAGVAKDLKHSNESLFVNCNFSIKDCKKDISRITSDPYNTSSHVYDCLSEIGLYCHKNRKFSSKIKDYFGDFVKQNKLEINDIHNWEPVVKVRVTLNPKQNSSIFSVGGLNEFFHADDTSKVRKIVSALFQELARINPDNLVAFRERMKNHYPYDRSEELAPILKNLEVSEDRSINVLEKVTDAEGNESWKIIRELKPGEHKNFVKFEFPNGQPVLDPIFNVIGGMDLKNQYDNIYSFSISPLIKEEKDGKKRQIKEDEYQHRPSFLPKKSIYCDIDSNRYRFAFKVNIPKREYGGGGGPASKTGMDNNSSEIDYDAYQEMEPNLYGIYSNGRLILNKNNSTIIQLASFAREAHPALYRRWNNLYEKATKVARQAQISSQKILEVSFYKNCRNEFEQMYGNAEAYYVNSHLGIIFDSEEAQKLIKDVDEIRKRD